VLGKVKSGAGSPTFRFVRGPADCCAAAIPAVTSNKKKLSTFFMIDYLLFCRSRKGWSLHPACVYDNEFAQYKHSNFAAAIGAKRRFAIKAQEFLKGSPE